MPGDDMKPTPVLPGEMYDEKEETRLERDYQRALSEGLKHPRYRPPTLDDWSLPVCGNCLECGCDVRGKHLCRLNLTLDKNFKASGEVEVHPMDSCNHFVPWRKPHD